MPSPNHMTHLVPSAARLRPVIHQDTMRPGHQEKPRSFPHTSSPMPKPLPSCTYHINLIIRSIGSSVAQYLFLLLSLLSLLQGNKPLFYTCHTISRDLINQKCWQVLINSILNAVPKLEALIHNHASICHSLSIIMTVTNVHLLKMWHYLILSLCVGGLW